MATAGRAKKRTTTNTLRLPSDHDHNQDDNDDFNDGTGLDDTMGDNGDDGGAGTAVAFGGLLVEIFDLFLTCVGSEDLREDSSVLGGFISANSLRIERTYMKMKGIDSDMDPPAKMQDVDPPGRKPDESKTQQQKTSTTKKGKKKKMYGKFTAKAKKILEKDAKSKAKQKISNNQRVYNILEESLHRRTTTTPSSSRSAGNVAYTFSLSTAEANGTKDIDEYVSSLDVSSGTYYTQEDDTKDVSETSYDDSNYRDDDDGRRDEVETERSTYTIADLVEVFESTISSNRQQKSSTIAKYNKKWPPLEFPTGRFESFNHEKLKAGGTTTTTTTDDVDSAVSNTSPGGGSASEDASSIQTIVWDSPWRKSKMQHAKQTHKKRQDILARAAAVRAEAAASRQDE